MRLDNYIYQKFCLKSRTYASRLIKDGLVLLNGKVCTVASKEIKGDENIEIEKDDSFASFGGEKLLKAFSEFSIDVKNFYCIDIGCSNGGFTDVLLQKGAKKVLAVDVGDCALPDRILKDRKVDFLKYNARFLTAEITGECDFVCVDCSFISLKILLPAILSVLKKDGCGILLIKPQFEVGKNALSKKGIVNDKRIEKKAVESVTSEAENLGFNIMGIVESPKKSQDKNQEYLLYVKKK
ncbi:MAG: TlyA family RNA methyltransferase [Christensenellales bacterium]